MIPSPDVRLGPFATTDVVSSAVLIPLETVDGEPIDLEGYAVVSASAVSPTADVRPLTGEIVELIDGSHVLEITFSGEAWDEAGEWIVSAVLTTPAGDTLSTEALRFIVETRDPGAWLTLAGIRALWRDAPTSDVALWRLLEIARIAISTYGRINEDPLPAPIPAAWRGVQRDYVRELWNAAKRDPGSLEIGDPTFAVQAPTLTPTMKDTIRPKRVRPVVA